MSTGERARNSRDGEFLMRYITILLLVFAGLGASLPTSASAGSDCPQTAGKPKP